MRGGDQVGKSDYFELRLFLRTLHLQEERHRKYSVMPADMDVAYIFKNQGEFEEYFAIQSIYDLDMINECKLKTGKNGSIVALKNLCDKLITEIRIENSIHGYYGWY